MSCSGTLTLSDGTTVGSSPSGSAQITAVAVDSVSLAGAPSSYTIGEAMTRKDFTITTTPSGYGNYQAYDGAQFLVGFSPATFNIAVGDNPATATRGVSEAGLTLVGVTASIEWGGTVAAATAPGEFNATYQAEVVGDALTQGKVSISGPFSAVGGDASPTITDASPYDGAVTLYDAGAQFSAANETAQLGLSEGGSGDSAMALPAIFASEASPGPVVLVGPAIRLAKAAVNAPGVNVLPAGVAGGLPITLVRVAGNYVGNPSSCSATVTGIGAGHGVIWVFERMWSDNPSATVEVSAPSPLKVTPIVNGVMGAPQQFLVEANETQEWEVQLGSNVIPDWVGDPPSQPSGGPANAAIDAFGQAPGDYWNLRKASSVANLDEPNNNWAPIAGTQSDQVNVYFHWF